MKFEHGLIAAMVFLFAVILGMIAIDEAEKKPSQIEISEPPKEMTIIEKEAELVKKGLEDVEQVAQEAREATEQAQEMTKEAISAKLPAKLVSIPAGTSVPGCEEVDLCYDPKDVTIFVGGEIIWRNDDSASHTVTSGTMLTGPDGNFDSGLILPEETFSTMFNESGDYPYFCMIHPWADGSVIVQ